MLSMSASSENEEIDELSNPEDGDETERTEIRSELKSLSFEELQKLKEKLGTKVYNEALFGVSTKRHVDGPPKQFKRENKNRPREMSSKRPVSMFQNANPVKKTVARDPRFDPLCGEFDKKTFKESYKFLDEVRANDLKSLKKKLKRTQDPERTKTIKYLIQRMENQNREENKLKQRKAKERTERQNKIEMLKAGKTPEYLRKSEKKAVNLVEQYEELKKTGKLQKHIERKRKKNVSKARKKGLMLE